MVYVFFTEVTVDRYAAVTRHNPVFLILAFVFVWIGAITFVLAKGKVDDDED